MRAVTALFRAEVLALVRRRSELMEPLVFLLIVVALFPLALGPRQAQLALLAPVAIWVAALLASCLALSGLFRTDHEEGVLDQMLLSPAALTGLVAAKVAAHWLLSGLPLSLICILAGVLLQIPAAALAVLALTLFIGTPVLSLVGAAIMALSVGLRGGTLPPLLLLPLHVPVLVFACEAASKASHGGSALAELYFLGGLLLLAAVFAPPAAALCLRVRLCG